MAEFFLFSGDIYYPQGGWHDFIGAFDTLADAKQHQHRGDWAHVVKEGQIVAWWASETDPMEEIRGWHDA